MRPKTSAAQPFFLRPESGEFTMSCRPIMIMSQLTLRIISYYIITILRMRCRNIIISVRLRLFTTTRARNVGVLDVVTNRKMRFRPFVFRSKTISRRHDNGRPGFVTITKWHFTHEIDFTYILNNKRLHLNDRSQIES